MAGENEVNPDTHAGSGKIDPAQEARESFRKLTKFHNSPEWRERYWQERTDHGDQDVIDAIKYGIDVVEYRRLIFPLSQKGTH